MNYLGIDYGTKRVGVAYSEGYIATAHSTLTYSSFASLVNQIAKLASELQTDTLVIGYPEGINRHSVDNLISLLEQLNLKVIKIDETMTTWQASQNSQRAKMNSRAAKKTIDARAAVIILQTYLDSIVKYD